jgi:hypothetical protein
MPYSPCGGVVTAINANLFLVEQVVVTAPVTVTALGVVGNQPNAGLQGFLALYTDMGGTPGTLTAVTNTFSVQTGAQEVPVVAPIALPPATYWIGGEYSGGAAICADNSISNQVATTMFPAFPTKLGSFGKATFITTADFNYYVVGTP